MLCIIIVTVKAIKTRFTWALQTVAFLTKNTHYQYICLPSLYSVQIEELLKCLLFTLMWIINVFAAIQTNYLEKGDCKEKKK